MSPVARLTWHARLSVRMVGSMLCFFTAAVASTCAIRRLFSAYIALHLRGWFTINGVHVGEFKLT